MSKIEYINKDTFSKAFKQSLKCINISDDGIYKFLNNSDISLKSLGICMSLTNIIDMKMKKLIPGYDGCLPHESFDKIYEWNKEQIYEFKKTGIK